MSRKLLALILVAVMAIGLVGCAGEPNVGCLGIAPGDSWGSFLSSLVSACRHELGSLSAGFSSTIILGFLSPFLH